MFQKKPPTKKFQIGMPKKKPILDDQGQEKYKPPTLHDRDDESPLARLDDDDDEDPPPGPPKRKLVTLDYDNEPATTKKRPVLPADDELVGDLDDERDLVAPRTVTGMRGFVPAGYAPPAPEKVEEKTLAMEQTVVAMEADEEEDEDDPLEAFMAGVNNQVKNERIAEKEKVRRDDLEEEDNIESYISHMKKKGITVGKGDRPPPEEGDENVNSDDEVYATAAAIDAALDYDSDDTSSGVAHVKKDIDPLARVDHSTINYCEINKCFYEEHPDVEAMTPAQVNSIRRSLDLRVSGAAVAKPCVSFAHFGFDEQLLDVIVRAGYTEPTGIQKQAIPCALEGRDVIGIAKTGSGKTAAFLLPMLVHIMDQEELERNEGPIGMVLAPTRELAQQIYTEAKKFAKAYGLKVAAVYGGASKMDQFKELRGMGPEILVGTPGRLIDMIKMKATNLRRVSYLVLDEADRMFDLGFEPQVRSICENVRPDRQTLLFSATFAKKVEHLAREQTNDPLRITIGSLGQANEDVAQTAVVVEDDSFKWGWVVARLAGFCAAGSVLVFVSRKGGVDELAENLQQAGFECGALHGDMMQADREKVIRDYKANKFPILVATDVAARGLDIKSVRTVLNYDVARDIDSHTHRVGRTGRAGEKGAAYTLITRKEDRFAGEFVRNLEQSGQPVPQELMELAQQNPRFRKQRQGFGGGGGRGRGGGGRGRGRGRGGAGRGGGGANSVPLGGGGSGGGFGHDRAGIGARSEGGYVPPPQQQARGPGLGMPGFARAATAEAGAGGLRSVNVAQGRGRGFGMAFQRAGTAEAGAGGLNSVSRAQGGGEAGGQAQQGGAGGRRNRWDAQS